MSFCNNKNNPIAVYKITENKKVFQKSSFTNGFTLISFIFFEFAVFAFFYSLGSRKMLTGLIKL